MQKVIAQYGSLDEAYRAVRELELSASIQNVIITEAHRRPRRTLREALRHEPRKEEVAYQVVVQDEPWAIERLLRKLGPGLAADKNRVAPS